MASNGDYRRVRSARHLPGAVGLAAALLLASCGQSDEATIGSAVAAEVDARIDTEIDARIDTGTDTGTDPETDAGIDEMIPQELAATEDPAVEQASVAESAAPVDPDPTLENADQPAIFGLPDLAAIDAILASLTLCLNAEGAEVEDIGIEQLMAKVPLLPQDAGRAEMFGFFYGQDFSEPEIAAAVTACSDIVDNPAIAMFIPNE